MGQVLSFGLKFGMACPPGLKLLGVFKQNMRVCIHYTIDLFMSDFSSSNKKG